MLFWSSFAWAQKTGVLKGQVTDDETGETLIGGTVTIIGTYKGANTDLDGNYIITDIKPGEYSIRFTYAGYNEKIYNAIKITDKEPVVLNVKMSNKVQQVVEIIGEKSILNLESGKSEVKIGMEEIKDMNVTDVQSIATMQLGVSKGPDGLQIRGGRVYETQYVVDGVSASDPLAGTGFGVDIAKDAIDEVEVVTGGTDAEYGDGTSGTIVTKTREGGKKLRASASWVRDNLGFNINKGASWNTDQGSFTLGGPLVPKFKRDSTKKYDPKLFFFTSLNMQLTDEYFHNPANQLHSSLMGSNDSLFAPREDNRWSGTLKLTYNIKPGLKLSVSTQQSLNINQNTRSLMVIGNDVVMVPGYQYSFALNMDNATTYSHKTNLSIINLKYFKNKWTAEGIVSRLFTNLRADANGAPFRNATVDRLYDPQSIVSDPVTVYNPGDSIIYVNPGPGLINNGGISTLWHDHYAQELTFKGKATYSTNNRRHFVTFGFEHKEQEYQWIDVTRPWIGAPIQINDSTTFASNRIGESNDIWKAKPATGGIYVQDEIRYKGIIAFVGLRFTYWAPGKFADNAVSDPNAPVLDATREAYQKESVPFLGRRFKARFLPKIRVSFPVTENNVLYFNYGHATRLAHPRFIYAGLDPVYQNRSFLANLGNPNLNPETTVSYEIGIKSQLTANWGLTFSAFYNDKFDFIVNRRIIVKDQSGRFVEKSFAINQDYARVRGLEASLTRRIGKWFRGTLSGSYQMATGKSNSALESLLQIKQSGDVTTSKEQFLAWDRPLDIKLMTVFKSDTLLKIGSFPIRYVTAFITASYKSGLRYTPAVQTGVDENTGRPIYTLETDKPYSKIGSGWFNVDFRITKEFKIFKDKKRHFSAFFELKNVLNNKNAQIVNPTTGKAYEFGDPVVDGNRDPKYPNPLDYGTPPLNPARYLAPRQMLFGLNLSL